MTRSARSAIDVDHGLAYDAMAEGASRPVKGTASIPWLDTFRMAKELGEMSILACSGSLDVLGIDITDARPARGRVGRHRHVPLAAEDGQIVFI